MVNDPVISEYVNRIGQSLALHSDVRTPVSIRVIDHPQVNASALPGSFVFVHTGVLLKADSEAEVAGVLAHELAHVAARQAVGLAVPLTFLKYSRNFEREADLLGLQYLYKAGNDPAAIVNFSEKLVSITPGDLGTGRTHRRTSSNCSMRSPNMW